MVAREMSIPVRYVTGGLSVVGVLNLLLLQWLFVRLSVLGIGRYRSLCLTYPVVPLTGWGAGSRFVFAGGRGRMKIISGRRARRERHAVRAAVAHLEVQ